MFREPTAAHFPGSALSRVFQPLLISSFHVRHAHRLLPSSHSWRLKANSKGGLGRPPFNCWTTPTWLLVIRLTLTLHVFVLLHHLLLHLLPFSLLVRSQNGVDFFRGRIVDFHHLGTFVSRG